MSDRHVIVTSYLLSSLDLKSTNYNRFHHGFDQITDRTDFTNPWAGPQPRLHSWGSNSLVYGILLPFYRKKIRQVYPVSCSRWLHNHTLFIKKPCKKLGVRPNFEEVWTLRPLSGCAHVRGWCLPFLYLIVSTLFSDNPGLWVVLLSFAKRGRWPLHLSVLASNASSCLGRLNVDYYIKAVYHRRLVGSQLK